MSTYKPDGWVVLLIFDGNSDFCKVFASWRDGSWRVNSGITRVERINDAYVFHGASGSSYMCLEGQYGVTTEFCKSVLNQIVKSAGLVGATASVMDASDNFFEMPLLSNDDQK